MDIEPNTNQTVIVPKEQARTNWATVSIIFAVVVSIVIGFWLWHTVFSEAWHLYNAPGPKDNPVPRTEALRNLTWSMGTIGAVFAGFIGLVMAGFRTASLHSQAATAKRDSELNEKKHQSEAFATAIEQLGHENFAVRLGAVYALEALARASLDLHGPIFEIICAYVRKNALETTAGTTPPIDIQGALTVIGRREIKNDPATFRIHLKGAFLTGADLSNGHFEGADFREADFNGADMRGAFLGFNSRKNVGTAFHRAQLQGANFRGTDLTGAVFKSSVFDTKTDFSYADLRQAKHIPYKNEDEFRNTTITNEKTQLPPDNCPDAWTS